MFRFVHAADIHLDSPLRGLGRGVEGAPVERVRAASREALRNLVDLCLDEDAAFLVIAGDLYDGDWRDYPTGQVFVAQMARLEKAGIPVFLLHGNHDAQSVITRALVLPANVRVFDADRVARFELDDPRVVLHGRSFATRAVLDDLSAGYGPAVAGAFNIGVLHTCLSGAEGHEPYAPCSEGALAAKGFDYWALGHVHEARVVREDPWIVFPGNLQGRHARETGPKGARLVTVRDGRVVSAEHRTLDAVRWAVLEVKLERDDALEDALERALAALERACAAADGRLLAVRVVFTGETAAHETLTRETARLRAECESLVHRAPGPTWLERVRVKTRPPAVRGDDEAGGPAAEVLEALRATAPEEVDATLFDAPLLEGKLGGRFPIDPEDTRAMADEARARLLAELEAEEPTS